MASPHANSRAASARAAEPVGGEEGAGSRDSVEVLAAAASAAARLRARCRWAGLVLLASVALPFEVIDGVPLFVWTILGELNPAAAAAAMVPAAGGVVVLAAARWSPRADSLAALVLITVGTMALIVRVGADAAAWDILPLPSSLTERPAAALAGMAAAGAAVHLFTRPHTHNAGRVLLAVALVCVLLSYFWPQRGDTLAATLLRALLAVGTASSFRVALGSALVLLLVLVPALSVAAAAVAMLWAPRTQSRIFAPVVTFALPIMLCVLVFRHVLLTLGDARVPALVGTAVLLAALLAVLASAAEVIGGLVAAGDLRWQQSGWELRRTVLIALGCSAVLVGVQWVWARPVPKGVVWQLRAATAAGDHLFGELLPRWAEIRSRWSGRAAEAEGAERPQALTVATHQVLAGAQRVDADLGAQLGELMRESEDLDLAGRSWFHLVERVNEASRHAGLPYYVDPTVRLRRRRDGLHRRFDLHSYRIAAVHPFATDAGPFATLHVRALSLGASHGRILGFSRDLQPFALVLLDETLAHADELRRWANLQPPSCGVTAAAPSQEMLRNCGQLLVTGLPERGLGAAVTRLTERHELQHQIDGPHLAPAARVLDQMAGYNKSAQDQVNREVSAYLAELTTPGVSPRLSLVHLVRLTTAPQRSGRYQVGLLALEALTGRQLRGSGGQVAYQLVSHALVELDRQADAQLRTRARDAWGAMFDGELVRIDRF